MSCLVNFSNEKKNVLMRKKGGLREKQLQQVAFSKAGDCRWSHAKKEGFVSIMERGHPGYQRDVSVVDGKLR